MEGIALMTVFTMFFIELMASRFDVFGEKNLDVESSDPTKLLLRDSEKRTDSDLPAFGTLKNSEPTRSPVCIKAGKHRNADTSPLFPILVHVSRNFQLN